MSGGPAMINSCPICGSAASETEFAVERAPVHRLIPRAHVVSNADFHPFTLVRCGSCGHLFNSTFEPEIGETQYHDVPLSNIPVHSSMVDFLRGIAELIGRSAYAGKRVVEIGAGTGHLARMLAQEAREVVVFEPCSGLMPSMLPEANVSMFNAAFDRAALDWKADLIVCRQVIEHVADPRVLVGDIAASLASDGLAYLEVPRAEYIVEHGAVCDLHLAHVQYFTEANFRRLAASAGLETLQYFSIKNGHDMGFVVRPARRDVVAAVGAPSARMAELLARRVSGGLARASSLDGTAVLYGATPTAQAFLGLFDGVCAYDFALDDNHEYAGYALYGAHQSVPILSPADVDLSAISTVIITSYLHDAVIAQKLRLAGFKGKILSTRPERPAARETAYEGFYV